MFIEVNMRKVISIIICVLCISATNAFGKNECTICFSQKALPKSGQYQFYMGVLGDDVSLSGGKCEGKTIQQMYDDGWRLIQVVSGLDQSFGIVFEKESKESKVPAKNR